MEIDSRSNHVYRAWIFLELGLYVLAFLWAIHLVTR